MKASRRAATALATGIVSDSAGNFTDEDGTSSLTQVVTLSEHSEGVKRYVQKFASAAGLPNPICEDLTRHLPPGCTTLAKSDPRFQLIDAVGRRRASSGNIFRTASQVRDESKQSQCGL